MVEQSGGFLDGHWVVQWDNCWEQTKEQRLAASWVMLKESLMVVWKEDSMAAWMELLKVESSVLHWVDCLDILKVEHLAQNLVEH